MTLYLEWMQLMELIIFEEKNQKILIRITDHGKEIFYKTKKLTTGISL